MNKDKNNIDRSHNFGGHLNKYWITQDLPRYQLAYERLSADLFKKFELLQKQDAAINTLQKYPILKSVLLEKIVLHYNSGKLLQSPSNITIIDLAFSTIACQTPTHIYSRKSIAGFKLSKFALLGAKTTLRSLAKYEFYYKFYFLGASQTLDNLASSLQHVSPRTSSTLHLPCKVRGKGATFPRTKVELLLQGQKQGKLFKSLALPKKIKLISTAFAIKNVFVFNELDNLDYDAFSNLAGFEIQFVNYDLS